MSAVSENPSERLIRAAAELWSGEETDFHWAENEYARGQVELIVEATGSPSGDADVEKDMTWAEIQKLVERNNQQ